jgi:hypothetical protein
MSDMDKQKFDDPEQSRRFIEAAKEHEADGDDAALARAVKRLASTPREPNVAPAKERRTRK